MGLSPDLISEFVKVTNDTKKSNTSNSMFGTVCEYDGSYYVKFDGSDLLTPISTTTDIHDGERVMVTIKNHTAIITGNMSSPSVNLETTIDNGEEGTVKLSELGISIHDGVVKINELEAKALTAESAVIKELKANDATISGKLDANEADIKTLKANDVTITGKLDANEADISKLKTDKLDASTADIKYATIENLKATNVNVDNLDADVADINTLIFGSAAGDTIHASFANAVIAQLGVAQIKSAMIDSVSADKITAGDIVTNNVRVVSEDGKLLISDETIQISDESRVRVQIGKDASGDYSINIWDADGNLMFSEGGITDSAIKEAIIRNDMVSENANISASKLDIDSLFTEINGSSKTIKSSKIYLNDEEQTLDVAFTSMTSDVDGLKNDVSSQGTQLSVVQGKIDSKVWQQDINSATGELNTKYSELEQNLDGFKTTVSETYSTKDDLSNLTIGGRNLLQNSTSFTVFSAAEGITGSITDDGCLQIVASSGNKNWISFGAGTDYTHVESELSEGDEFVISFTMRSPDTTDCPTIYIKSGMGYYKLTGTLSNDWSKVWYAGTWKKPNYIQFHLGLSDLVGTYEIKNCKIEKGNRPTDWTPAPEDIKTELTESIETVETKITQTNESIESVASQVKIVDDKFGNYSTTDEMNSAIKQKADSIELSVDSKIANINIGGRNLIPVSRIQSGRNVSSTEEFELRNAWATIFIANSDLVEILEPGTEYTVKYDLELIERTDVPTKFDMMVGFLIYSAAYGTWISLATNMSENAEIGTKTTVQKTFTTPDVWNDQSIICYSRRWTTNGSDPVGHDTFKVTDFKIEKGNKATDWTPAPEDVDESIIDSSDEVRQEIVEQNAKVIADAEGIILEALSEYTKTGDLDSYKETVSSELSVLSGQISANFTQTMTMLEEVNGDLQELTTNITKFFTFDINGLTIGQKDNPYKVVIDNDRYSMFVNDTEVLWIDIETREVHTPELTITDRFRMMGYQIEKDSSGNVNWDYIGGE